MKNALDQSHPSGLYLHMAFSKENLPTMNGIPRFFHIYAKYESQLNKIENKTENLVLKIIRIRKASKGTKRHKKARKKTF